MSKVKDSILNVVSKKQLVTYKGRPMRQSSDFSAETFQARRGWRDIAKVLRGRKFLLHVDQIDLRDIYRAYHTKVAEYTFIIF